MNTQLRNTQFGLLVRFISGNQRFRYPDEIDSTLCQKLLHHDATSAHKCAIGQADASEEREPPKESNESSTKDLESQGLNARSLNAERAPAEGKDIFLVDWYGPDDPEVMCGFATIR